MHEVHVTLEILDNKDFVLAYYDTEKDGHAVRVYADFDIRADVAAAIVAMRDWEDDE